MAIAERAWRRLFYFVPLRLADGRLALKMGDFEQALAVTDDLLADLRRFGMRSEISGTLDVIAQALLGLGQDEAARDSGQRPTAKNRQQRIDERSGFYSSYPFISTIRCCLIGATSI